MSDVKVRSKIEYVLFDMDGLMIDSERIYTDVTNEILAEYGKVMTWDIKAGLMGKPERDAAVHLLSHFPEVPITLDDYLTRRNILQDLRWPTVPLLPGIRRLISHLYAHKIPMVVATGSRRRNMEMKSEHLQNVFGLFEGKIVCADDWIGERGWGAREAVGGVNEGARPVIEPGRGKPCPDLFLLAAREALERKVGSGEGEAASEEERVERLKGLVFEDAIPGVHAGKRAGMNVVWVPDANLLEVKQDGQYTADQILRSLEEFKPEEWGLPPYDS